MAKDRRPKGKLEARYGEPILNFGKTLERSSSAAPHRGKRRQKLSEYGMQLRDKQKAKLIYGLLEKQFRNLFQKAVARKGVTGEVLLQLLERRLDNTVFRLRMAATRRSARQMVSHGHIQVNGRRVNIPSYQLSIGDTISLAPASRSLPFVQHSLQEKSRSYPWLRWDEATQAGTLAELPTRDQIPERINEQSIVELYSR